MVRCAQCGCRLAPHDPVCPAHGPQELPPEGARLAPPPTPQVAGFSIQKLLGQGGFGAVYRAERQSDGRLVALKLALGENHAARASLKREIWALKEVPPPATPAFLGEGEAADGSPYLALEYITAPTLGDVMEEMPGHWTVDRMAAVALPLLKAMAAVHEAGIVHRDVKPENFFVVGQGTEVKVRVFDFGLSAPAGQMPDADSAREGTPEYMAPEQDAADLSMDPRADGYSLGVMLFELLAGCLPFAGTAADMREGHRSRRPPLFARLLGHPKPLETFVLTALAKDRERRFATAGEMYKALLGLRVHWQVTGGDGREPTSERPAPSTGPQSSAVPATLTTGTFAAAAPAAKPKAEQRPMGLLFFKPKDGQAVGPAEARRLGAELASASPALGLVLAFDHEASDNPVRMATTAAQRVLEQGLSDRALVDAFSVLVQIRPNGQRRFVSATFNRKDRYPTEALGDGVFLSSAALDLVPQVDAVPVEGQPDLHRMVTAAQRELTVVGAAARHAFVGRDAELEQLFSTARKTVDEKLPTIATVVAEGGLGKSELAGALASGLPARLPEAETFAFRCSEGLEGGQSRTVAELLRWALKVPREAPADQGRGVLVERLGLEPGDSLWAATALALGWATVALPDLKEILTAPGALRAALARAVGESLRIAARKQPVLVVADDAHLADETLLDGLEYATLEEGAAAVWVCVLTRPSLLVGRPLLGARAARNPKLELSPLRNEDAILLARLLLAPAENIPASALQKLVSRTQGNPLLLVELIRGLKRDGAIKRSAKGEYHLAVEAIDQLPDSPVVQWLATREIEALPADLAAHARLAALLGSDLTETEMEGVITLSEEEGTAIETLLDAGVGLRRLVESGVLVRHRSGRFSFRYGVLRDATYGMVPEAQRKEVHALAYRYYDAHAQIPEDEALPRLAFHSARAGMRAEAKRHYINLADRARQRHAYLEASNLYNQARAQMEGEDRSELMPVALAHSLMQFRLGLYEQSLGGLTETRQLAQQLGNQRIEFEALVEMSTVMDFLHHYEHSRKCIEEAVALQPDDDKLTVARLEFGRARSLYRFSQVTESIPKLLEAARVAESLGDAGYETRIGALQMAGPALATEGKLDEALEIFDEMLALSVKHGDVLHETATLGNRAYVWLPLGNFAQMRTEYERALMLARENCFTMVESNLFHNLAEVSLLTGDLEAADGYAARVVALTDRLTGQSQYPALVMLLLRARAKAAVGDEASAQHFLAEIKRRQEASRGTETTIDLMPSDAVLRDAVDLATRDATEEEWQAVLARSKEFSIQFEGIEILALRGLSVARRGQRDAGKQALEQALEVARGMTNPLIPQLERWLSDIAA